MTASGIGYTAALTLAALFAVAAISKLRSPDDSARSFEDLGVPNAALVARFVPVAELATVVLLVLVPAIGGMVALVLLAFFTTFLIGRLRAGVRVPCNCFGDVVARRLSWLAIVRNGMFMVLAGLSLMAPRPVRPTIGDALVVVGGTLIGLAAATLAGEREPSGTS